MKYNKLIAEFMGMEYLPNEWVTDGVIETGEKNQFQTEELIFHASWDWLMPVVRKIENETS